MDNHFAKFAFLAVMIGVVLFSRMAYPTEAPGTLADISNSAKSASAAKGANSMPIFIPPPTAVSAENSAATETGTSSTGATAAHPTGVTQPPTLNNAADLLANLTTGVTYDAVNINDRWPTASLAKLMSATIVLDKLDPATRITITEDMFAADPTEFTLSVGGTYTVNDLLHLMLLPSSNVAAEAVATFYGRNAFIAEMNSRAAAWGMADTHYDDPSGISVGDESTASDLAKLAQKVYASYPEILQISRTPQYDITELNSGRKILIKSINDFVGTAGFIGGKTGHTDQADGNLLSLFDYENQVVLVITLGSNDRFSDTGKLYDWYKENL